MHTPDTYYIPAGENAQRTNLCVHSGNKYKDNTRVFGVDPFNLYYSSKTSPMGNRIENVQLYAVSHLGNDSAVIRGRNSACVRTRGKLDVIDVLSGQGWVSRFLNLSDKMKIYNWSSRANVMRIWNVVKLLLQYNIITSSSNEKTRLLTCDLRRDYVYNKIVVLIKDNL